MLFAVRGLRQLPAYRAAHGWEQSSIWKRKRQPKLEQQGSCNRDVEPEQPGGDRMGVGPDEVVEVNCNAKD